MSDMELKHGNSTNSMEMYFLTRSTRCPRLEKKYINNVIRENIDVESSVLDCIIYKQLNSYGHVRRMIEERLLQKTFRKENKRNTSRFVDAGSNNWNEAEES